MCDIGPQGRLAIEHCSLELDPAGGLPHLFAPIVTTAAGVLPGGGRGGGSKRRAATANAGHLSVSETRIQVRCRPGDRVAILQKFVIC